MEQIKVNKDIDFKNMDKYEYKIMSSGFLAITIINIGLAGMSLYRTIKCIQLEIKVDELNNEINILKNKLK